MLGWRTHVNRGKQKISYYWTNIHVGNDQINEYKKNRKGQESSGFSTMENTQAKAFTELNDHHQEI